MRQISILDTTLRDGEQSPGCGMNVKEKIDMSRQLESLGVSVIEAGFAAASQADFNAVRAVAKELQRTRVTSLSRALMKDIDSTWEALRHAKYPRIHLYIANLGFTAGPQTPEIEGRGAGTDDADGAVRKETLRGHPVFCGGCDKERS